MPGFCVVKVMFMKREWWKSVAVLCLILQVGFLAAGLLHFTRSGCHDNHLENCEHLRSGFPHAHVVSPHKGGEGHEATLCRPCCAIPEGAETSKPFRWAMSGNVVPCPSEHCLICSLSDLVCSSDVESTGEPLGDIFSVRRSADVHCFYDLQGVFRPCLPRGPPVVS